jgi:hypothetical protein
MLLTAADCASALAIDQTELESDWLTMATAAEAAVSSHMTGNPAAIGANLAQVETIYPSGRNNDIPLVYGPVSALGVVKLNGSTLSNTPKPRYALKTLYGITMLRVNAYDRPLNAGDEVEVNYTQGWTSANMPDWLKAALLAEFVHRYDNPGASDIKSEKLGDYSVSYGDPAALARSLLQSSNAKTLLVGSRSWMVAGAR